MSLIEAKQVELFIAWQANPGISSSALRSVTGVAWETAATYKARFEMGFTPATVSNIPEMVLGNLTADPDSITTILDTTPNTAEARHDNIQNFPIYMSEPTNPLAVKLAWVESKLAGLGDDIEFYCLYRIRLQELIAMEREDYIGMN